MLATQSGLNWLKERSTCGYVEEEAELISIGGCVRDALYACLCYLPPRAPGAGRAPPPAPPPPPP